MGGGRSGGGMLDLRSWQRREALPPCGQYQSSIMGDSESTFELPLVVWAELRYSDPRQSRPTVCMSLMHHFAICILKWGERRASAKPSRPLPPPFHFYLHPFPKKCF